MKRALQTLLLILIAATSFGQQGAIVPIGNSRPIDTNLIARSLRVDSALLITRYSNSDTERYATFNNKGLLEFRRLPNLLLKSDSLLYATQWKLDTGIKNTRAWASATFGTGTGTVTSVAATAGTGISVSGSPITSSGTLTITNTAPDQTVTCTAQRGVRITGTYPNFTFVIDSSTVNTRRQDDSSYQRKVDSNINGGYMAYWYWLQNRNLGTVTSITASSPLTGGTITSSGSIGLGTVGYANGGTNATSFTSQRLIFSGVNTLKAHDSMAVDTAAANGYVGLGTITPTTPIHIKRNKTINITSEYTGAQSGLFVAGIQMKNASSHTFDIGIADNSPTGKIRIGGTEYASFNNAQITFGTLSGSSSPQNFFQFTANPANTSGTSLGAYYLFGGNNSSTGGYTGMRINSTTTFGGSGTQSLFELQRFGSNRFRVDTAGGATMSTIIGGGSSPTISAGAGAGTSPTVSMGTNSSDVGGNFTVTTGTLPTAGATIATVTFAIAKSRTPTCVQLSAANNAAAGLIGAGTVEVDLSSLTTSKFDVFGTLAPSTTYVFFYIIID